MWRYATRLVEVTPRYSKIFGVTMTVVASLSAISWLTRLGMLL